MRYCTRVEPEALIQGLLWFAVFLFSTTVHEASHALAALRGGDPTAYLGGQVSLSPLPHIRREPIGMLVVPLLTAFTNGWAVGWASTPYDPVWASNYPRRAATMAAAGPASNLLIALLAFAAIRGGLLAGLFASPERSAPRSRNGSRRSSAHRRASAGSRALTVTSPSSARSSAIDRCRRRSESARTLRTRPASRRPAAGSRGTRTGRPPSGASRIPRSASCARR